MCASKSHLNNNKKSYAKPDKRKIQKRKDTKHTRKRKALTLTNRITYVLVVVKKRGEKDDAKVCWHKEFVNTFEIVFK